MTVERALRTVERTARESVEWPASPAVPRKLRMNVYRKYRPIDHQVDALEELETALAVDLRFEHMKKREIEEAVEGFANDAFVYRNADHLDLPLRRNDRRGHSQPGDTGPSSGFSVPRREQGPPEIPRRD
jgi:hypothetical protein